MSVDTTLVYFLAILPAALSLEKNFCPSEALSISVSPKRAELTGKFQYESPKDKMTCLLRVPPTSATSQSLFKSLTLPSSDPSAVSPPASTGKTIVRYSSADGLLLRRS